MCQVETSSISSRNCYYAREDVDGTPHVWTRLCYMLCDRGESNGHPCRDSEETESQNTNGMSAGSTSGKSCRICDQMGSAENRRREAIEKAEKEYIRAQEEAYNEVRLMSAPRSRPRGSEKREKDKTRHRGEKSHRTKHYDNNYKDGPDGSYL